MFSIYGNAQIVSTIAGTGISGTGTDGVLGTNSNLKAPYDVGTDGVGNVYFTDPGDMSVRKIDVNTGIVSTIFNNGIVIPWALFVESNGDCYFSDTQNQDIWKYTKATNSSVIIVDAAGDVMGICVYGDSLLMAYPSDHKIKIMLFSTGVITDYAGTGTAGYNGENQTALTVQFDKPTDIAFDLNGDLIVCDQGNNRIRRISSGLSLVTTIVGNTAVGFNGNDILATNAYLNSPEGITVDANGIIYISDSGNNMIRKVDPSNDIIKLVAGNTTAGFVDGDTSVARFDEPLKITIDSYGSVFTSDFSNYRIRKIQNCLPANIPTVELGGFTADDCPQELYLFVTNTDLNDNQKWVWYFENCGTQLLGEGDTLAFNPFFTNTFYVRGEGGCADSPNCSGFPFDALTCNIDSTSTTLIAPTAFSPNGDGINESWIVEGIDSVLQNKVYIYNRWGDLVYFTESYNNIDKVWSGMNYLTNERVSVGTFFYVIESNQQRVKSGWVQVIR